MSIWLDVWMMSQHQSVQVEVRLMLLSSVLGTSSCSGSGLLCKPLAFANLLGLPSFGELGKLDTVKEPRVPPRSSGPR